jgi:uncharacterized protein (DUF2141 family)
MTEKKVARLKLSAARAQERVREAAVNSANVQLTLHALERMEQRGFVTRDVYDVLRTGFVDEDPIEVRAGEWKCKVTQKVGGRTAGAVTLILQNGRLRVVTVEWEDGK